MKSFGIEGETFTVEKDIDGNDHYVTQIKSKIMNDLVQLICQGHSIILCFLLTIPVSNNISIILEDIMHMTDRRVEFNQAAYERYMKAIGK